MSGQRKDPFQFQWWCCAMLGARGEESSKQGQAKKGADRGIDGTMFYQDPPGEYRRVLVSVKGGKTTREQVQVLAADVKNQDYSIGVLVTLEAPTGPMRAEAIAAGRTEPTAFSPEGYPRIQLLTVAEILDGGRVRYPMHLDATFKRAVTNSKTTDQNELF